MKKMFILVLVVFLTFILTGCRKEETKSIKTDGLGSIEETFPFKEIMVENIIVEDIIVEDIIVEDIIVEAIIVETIIP